MKKYLATIVTLGLGMWCVATYAHTDSTNTTQTSRDEIITGERLAMGAQSSAMLFIYCLNSTWYRLSDMFPERTQTQKISDTASICKNYQDKYQLYNILLATDSLGAPKSEAWARQVLEVNRKQDDNPSDKMIFEMIENYLNGLAAAPKNNRMMAPFEF